jgi:protein tyrosine/serine phosphatase
MRADPHISAATAATLLALSLAAPSTARVAVTDSLSSIQIANFGQVDEGYYRGARPRDHDYADLAALGIRTVIDLTGDSDTDAAEPWLVKRAGMKSFRLPMSTQSRPRSEDVALFLRLVNDPANRPVFVHCVGGRHRTGTMTAVYRMTEDGWTADRAYQEMKKFRFEGFPDHPVLRRFVFDYYAQLERARSVSVPTAVASP